MYAVSNGRLSHFSIPTENGSFAISTNDHFELVRVFLRRFEQAFLVSPFLFEDFGPLFAGIDLREKRLELVTSFSARGNDLLTKPFSMRSFGDLVQEKTNVWPPIHVDQSLHSKVFVFYDGGRPVVGIVTSANLTHGGLQNNSETGIVLTDETTLVDIRDRVERNIDYVHITEQQIGILCGVVNSFRSSYPPGPDIDIGLPGMLKKYCAPSAGNSNVMLGSGAKFFIKVSGVKDDPIRIIDKRSFDTPHPDLSFAKMPTPIRVGDVLIEAAVGAKAFLTYYVSSSGGYMRSPDEQKRNAHHARWKYYMYGNNCAPAYGRSWFEDPLFYDDVIKQFKSLHPTVAVTAAGGDHIQPAINYGHSFLEITKEFGEFVTDLIDARGRQMILAGNAKQS